MAPLPPHFVTDDQGYDSPATTPTLINKSSNNSMEVLQPLTRALVRHSSSIIRNLSKNTLTELVNNTTRRDDSSITEVPVTFENQIRPLQCAAQEYAWGRTGMNSTVARMKDANDASFQVKESTPYAELWLGTHPNGMSTVVIDNQYSNEATSSQNQTQTMTLLDYVQSNPELHCGSNEQDLTFLFKVLSIEKVLSIQAHPDQQLAQRLHVEKPHLYKDPNHKPEMAIALSQRVRAMCGFRSLLEISHHLQIYPEFAALVGSEATQNIRECCQDLAGSSREGISTQQTKYAIQQMFESFLTNESSNIHTQLDLLLTRLATQQKESSLSKVEQLMMQLSTQFPHDSGIMAPLFLNIVELSQGEALFIGANEPHAYISGEILECMACSDNVVRAGLTPKPKDVQTLVEMCTYESEQPPLVQYGTLQDTMTMRYEPPVQDFCVEMIIVPPNSKYDIVNVPSPSTLLTLSGSAFLVQYHQEDNDDDDDDGDDTSSSSGSNATTTTGVIANLPVSFGSAAFCSANTRTTIVTGPNEGVHLTRAFTNVYYNSSPQDQPDDF